MAFHNYEDVISVNLSKSFGEITLSYCANAVHLKKLVNFSKGCSKHIVTILRISKLSGFVAVHIVPLGCLETKCILCTKSYKKNVHNVVTAKKSCYDYGCKYCKINIMLKQE